MLVENWNKGRTAEVEGWDRWGHRGRNFACAHDCKTCKSSSDCSDYVLQKKRIEALKYMSYSTKNFSDYDI